jgi:hypothetical protein
LLLVTDIVDDPVAVFKNDLLLVTVAVAEPVGNALVVPETVDLAEPVDDPLVVPEPVAVAEPVDDPLVVPEPVAVAELVAVARNDLVGVREPVADPVEERIVDSDATPVNELETVLDRLPIKEGVAISVGVADGLPDTE